ncbi:MAG TPA: VOC family protein [Solirubrobacterales bacterium]
MTTTTSLVTGVDFVSLPTRDLGRGIEFYADVLGLERSKVWGKSDADAMGAEFETGTVTIALVLGERIGIAFQPNSVPIALQVEDVEASRAELESKGVEFSDDIIDSGVCFMAMFRDPDGNALMLHHRYAPKE